MAREGGGFDPRQEHLAGFGSPVSNRVSSLRKGFANTVPNRVSSLRKGFANTVITGLAHSARGLLTR